MVTTISFVFLALACNRQDATQQIYSSTKALVDQNLMLKKWGGGSIAETPKVVYKGKRSILIESQNYFQGGTLSFVQPVDWTEASKDPSNVLRFTYFLTAPTVIIKTPKNSVLRTKTHEQYVYNRQTRTPIKSVVTQLRLVVNTTDGLKSEFYLPIGASQPTTKAGWRTVALPLVSIHGFAASNKSVSGITLSTDSTGKVYLDDMRIVKDDAPITGEARPTSASLRRGDSLTFTATADSGLTPVVFRWDFGEDAKGIETDAEGARVKHRFRKAGNFKVTLTIADRFGYKKPYQQVIPIKVAG